MRGKQRPAPVRLATVAMAEVRGIPATSEASGIPERTIRLWMDRPEYADMRAKTRDELSDGFRALAHLAMTRLMEAIETGNVEPRDLSVALGIAVDKHLLMSGAATARTESRSLDGLNDHESAALQAAIDGELRRRGDQSPAADPSDAAVEEPSST